MRRYGHSAIATRTDSRGISAALSRGNTLECLGSEKCIDVPQKCNDVLENYIDVSEKCNEASEK